MALVSVFQCSFTVSTDNYRVWPLSYMNATSRKQIKSLDLTIIKALLDSELFQVIGTVCFLAYMGGFAQFGIKRGQTHFSKF